MASKIGIFTLLISSWIFGDHTHVAGLTVSTTVDSPAPSNGSDVVFTCQYTLEVDETLTLLIVWYVGDLVSNASRISYWFNGNVVNEPGFDDQTYVMNDDQIDNGHVTLTINPVKRADEGKYWCQVTADGATLPSQGDDADIIVAEPPSNVNIRSGSNDFNQGDVLPVLLDDKVEFICTTSGVKPAATLSWTLGGSNVSPDLPQEDERNGDLFDSKSRYTLQAALNDHDQKLNCTSSSTPPADPSSLSLALDLYVQVPPNDGNVVLSDSNPYNDSIIGSVREGEEHTFHCDVTGTRPEVTISWTKDGQQQQGETTSQENRGLWDTLGTLKITPIRADHRRILKCEADIDIDGVSPVSKEVILQVYGPPDYPPVLDGTTDLTDGVQSNDLTCTASNAYPNEGSITWYNDATEIKKGARFPANGDRFDIVDTLNFIPVRMDNQQEIKCEVRHSTLANPSFLYASTLISVKFCPINVTIVECPSVVVGQKGLLTCASSSSNPESTLRWYEETEQQENTHQQENMVAEYYGHKATLQFQTRTVERNDYDSISLHCCAVNMAARCREEDMCSNICKLNIHYPPEDVEIVKSTDDPVREGGNITLTCKAAGNPEPSSFKWQRDNSIIDSTSKKLTYNVVTRDKAGMYKCTAENGIAERVESTSIPVPVYYPATIDKEQDTRGVEPGQDISLECIAHGLPTPNITWIHPNGHSVNETERTTVITSIESNDDVHGTIVKSLLMISDVSSFLDYGMYHCKASNSEGGDVFPIYLNAAPRPVSDLKIVGSTLSSLTVNWIPGYSGGEGLTQWFIIDYRQYTEGKPRGWLPETMVNGSNTYNVQNLEEDTTYDIRVFSENNVGRNPNGQVIQGKTVEEPVPVEPEKRNNAAIFASLGAIIVLFFVIIVILIVFNFRLRHKQRLTDEPTVSITKPECENNFEIAKEDYMNDGFSVETSFQKQHSENRFDNALVTKDFILPRNKIKIERDLGHGEFGKVMKATAKGITPGEESTTVAVKTLKDNANDEAKQLLTREFEIMKVLMVALRTKMNPNIVLLIGGCMEKDPLYMVLEYMPKGDLKSLLRESRASKDGNDKTYDNLAVGSRSLSPVQLIKFAQDVANGMAFLATQKCIHRDLAARNVLLNEKYECKVSDFGLAQDVMNIEVYQRTNQCRLPIRWMAIESLDDKVHTLESDIWAYGVLLWEIITLGARPYPRMKADEIRQMLRTGYRMPKPNHCSEQLYNIMLVCWEKDQSKRPSFPQIIRLLDEIIEGQMGYLTLANIESKLYEDTTIAAPDEKI